jgi:hypothetical protein
MNKRIFVLLVIVGLCAVNHAEAARPPELFVHAMTGSAVAQVNIIDADPNASVSLYYQANGAKHSLPLGVTNASGNLSATVDASKYGITVGSQAYAVSNGASSPLVAWPDYTNGGSLHLDPTILTLAPGQSSIVTAGVSADLTLGSHSASAVASASIMGRQISVRALSPGTDNISVCAVGLGCSTITVNVTSSNGTNIIPASFSFSTAGGNGSQVTLGLGQTLSIPLLGNESHIFSVAHNSNPTVIGASANGATLHLTAAAYGGSNIEVCEFEGQCALMYAYVAVPQVSTPAPATPTPSPVTPPPSSSRVVFDTYLKPGSVGTQVRALQSILIKLGYLKHVATGYYGNLTVDAVATLQAKHNLAALGVVGPATRALLNSMPQ